MQTCQYFFLFEVIKMVDIKMTDKIDELAMNSQNKNIRELYRGTNEFKKGY